MPPVRPHLIHLSVIYEVMKPTNHYEPPEILVAFVQVLKEDKTLRDWFFSLERLPENSRLLELGHIQSRFKGSGVNFDFVELTKHLSNEDVFRAVLNIVRVLWGHVPNSHSPGAGEVGKKLTIFTTH